MIGRRYLPKRNQTPKSAASAHAHAFPAYAASGKGVTPPRAGRRHAKATIRSTNPVGFASRVPSGEYARKPGKLEHFANKRSKRRGSVLAATTFALFSMCALAWGHCILSASQPNEPAQTQTAEQALEENASTQQAPQTQEQADPTPVQAPDDRQDLARHRRNALGFIEGQSNSPRSARTDAMQEAGFVGLIGASARVPALYQYPSMPAGCEVYSLTAVLVSLGVNANPDDIVASYLPFDTVDGDYATVFWGDPYSTGEGMPPAIMLAGNAVLQDASATARFEIATGTDFVDLANAATSGSPILVWTTLGFEDPQFDEPLEANSIYYLEHCVVLLGAHNGEAYLMDPTQGYTSVSYDWFEYLYEQCGSMALKLA